MVKIKLCELRDAVVVFSHISPLLTTVSSSSEVRASVLDHGGSWVQIPSGFFSEFLVHT